MKWQKQTFYILISQDPVHGLQLRRLFWEHETGYVQYYNTMNCTFVSSEQCTKPGSLKDQPV